MRPSLGMRGSYIREDLQLGPIGHTVVAVGIGAAVWSATEEPAAVPVAIATGVLIDSDHILDWMDWLSKGYKSHLLVLFHAWEYTLVGLLVLATFWYHPLLLAAVLGHLGHLIGDQIANPVHPLGYSIIYRITHRFDHGRLVHEHRLFVPHEEVPLWGQVEPWLWKFLQRRRHSRQA